jgi:hypothetical protein
MKSIGLLGSILKLIFPKSIKSRRNEYISRNIRHTKIEPREYKQLKLMHNEE